MIGFKEFLVLNAIVAVLFLLSFLSARRKPLPPSRLNLRGKSDSGGEVQVKKKPLKPRKVRGQRDLTVLFDYQGQTCEAHEVLGVPAGGSSQEIKKAYEGLMSSQSGDLQLVEKAYAALKNQ